MDRLLPSNGIGDVSFWDTLTGAIKGGVEAAATPLVQQAVQQAQPSLQASAQSGAKQWLSENSGMLIVGVLALVAIIVLIIFISRGSGKRAIEPQKVQ